MDYLIIINWNKRIENNTFLILGIFGESYQNNCKKCTEKQKIIFKQVEDWYLQNRPDKWEKVLAKIRNTEKKAHQ